MFDLQHAGLFMLATIMLNLTPGPDMLYVATRTLGQGRKAGLASSFGIGVGCLVHVAAATLGLSAILTYSSTAYQVVKYAGAAYLVYLGIRTFRSVQPLGFSSLSDGHSLRRVFWQGALTNVLNPKVALFFLSFLPQFVDSKSGSVAKQIISLGMMFDVSGTTVLVIVALLFGQAAVWLEARPKFWHFQRWFTGSVFVSLGVRLAIPNR